MSRKKIDEKLDENLCFEHRAPQKRPLQILRNNFKKIGGNHENTMLSKKSFSFQKFRGTILRKKKLNDHRQFFAVILIEKLGENHRVSNPVVKKMS